MSRLNTDWLKMHWQKLMWPVLLVAVASVAWLTQDRWRPAAQLAMDYLQNRQSEVDGHSDEAVTSLETQDTLTLSPTAWRNIGLETGQVEPRDYERVVSVPAMVVERPGRSTSEITAPMTGIVTQVYPLERQAVEPGVPLFDLRLTHEDVVTAQTEFLANLQKLEVATQELNRLENIGEGVIPGNRIIAQRYERDKIQAEVAARRQSLLLHGIDEEQIARIEATRNVLREITVVAPEYANHQEHEDIEHQYYVQSIKVSRGQSVIAGQTLARLSDHCLLYVEGKAFEDDAARLVQASLNDATIEVVPASGDAASDVLELKVQSVANEVDQQSRALRFYLLLPNEIVNRDASSVGGSQFIAWKYRPGQRMEARIPTSTVMKNKIVLPPGAVVLDGPNAFVFEQNGDNFDRIDVQVLYRDKNTVVLENDGQLVGSVLAMNGAYQMHLALKNQSGGAIDPHAGHSH